MEPLRKLNRDVKKEKLNECHKVICPDLSLRDFVSEYKDATELEKLQSFETR